jgi:DnaJ-domain-containing protein 1
MQKKCNFWSVSAEPMQDDAFKFNKKGESRKNSSVKAAQMAKCRQVAKICNAILNRALSQAQQILAFCDAANHPQLQGIVKALVSLFLMSPRLHCSMRVNQNNF